MFDIVEGKFITNETAERFGFEKIYTQKEIKIVVCENLTESAKDKNSKTLISIKEINFDLGALKLLAEKKKACLLIDLSKVIGSRGLRRAIEMAKLRTLLKYCNKYGTYYAFATFSKDEFSMRTNDELIAIAGLLGVNTGQAKFALKMIKHYA